LTAIYHTRQALQPEAGEIEGCLCSPTVTTLNYLIRKASGARKACESITFLLSLFEIAPVNKIVLEGALNLPFKEFEDAVLHEAARIVNADVIVTHKEADFNHSSIPVSPAGELEVGKL
jgi:hypothetical protein